ncbi:hypothetical protein quinque_015829 [Culex quinquefasciatus]
MKEQIRTNSDHVVTVVKRNLSLKSHLISSGICGEFQISVGKKILEEKLELLITHSAEASKKPQRIIWIKIRRLGRVDLLLDAVTWSAI